VYYAANNTCILVNSSFCYGNDTVSADGVTLYGKMTSYSNLICYFEANYQGDGGKVVF
jgi:hypothetical protein